MSETLLTRKSIFRITELAVFKKRALQWANRHEVVCYFDSNSNESKQNAFECLIGVGAEETLINYDTKGAFDQLKEFYDAKKDWLFGFLSYDLKNDVERLESLNKDYVGLPSLHFFRPQYIIAIKNNEVQIITDKDNADYIFHQIEEQVLQASINEQTPIDVKARISKERYINTIETIRTHIIEGDIYEMNFCQEFYATDCNIEPLELFNKLNQLAKAPFSSYYKLKDRYVVCSSPERFIKKCGNQLLSQPIKGTIKRGSDELTDQLLKKELFNSPKDRAENVMIVDLVRNDLSRSCKAGSVKVEELFGIYGFKHVYHMISTITGELSAEVHFVDAIKNAFPMGSMTGAPKVMSMKLIEEYEQSKRGLYSGAIGYITPEGDFDFNVVIRSILYNAADKYLAYQVGGAIVYDSDPEKEYEECLLKAKGMLTVLGQ